MLGRGLQLNTAALLVFFLQLAKPLRNFEVNSSLPDHLERWGLFSDFQYVSSRSSTDLLTVVSDRIARTFNTCRATWAVTLDISKAFDRVWDEVFFTNLSPMEFQVRYLTLFHLLSVIDGFEWFLMESLHKDIHLMVMLVFLKSLYLMPHFSY